MFAKRSETKKGARRRVSRVLSRPSKLIGAVMAIPLGRSLPNASCDRPERRRGRPARQRQPKPTPPAAPTWSCSRWGLPCRRRCRRRGALLPHHFTLAARRPGRRRARRCVSVALSLGSPPPGVTRHRASVEPGLSSLRPRAWPERRAAIRPSDWDDLGCRAPPVKSSLERLVKGRQRLRPNKGTFLNRLCFPAFLGRKRL